MGFGVNSKFTLSRDGKEKFDEYSIEINDIGGGVEPYYFTVLRLMRIGGYDIQKVQDIFASSEMSSFWGDTARRRGEQESRAMQLMGTLNGMLKDLFKVMRELSIIDERLGFYKDFDEGKTAGDSALKDIWISLVEQGSKNPGSVIGLATQVGFVSLPDYFYMTFVKKRDEIDSKVNAYDISEKLSYTLKRKLEQYLMWKERTQKELMTRQKFVNGMLKTLISEIRMYVQWVKPYIKSIKKLQDETSIQGEPDLVTAFETSVLRIGLEAFAPGFMKKDGKTKELVPSKNYVPVARINFEQTTSPGEVYQRNYQKGFVHRGRVKITMEAWVYNKDTWLKEKKKEDEDLISFLSRNVDESIEAMKDDLIKVMDGDYESLFQKPKGEEPKKVVRQTPASFMKNLFPFISYVIPDKAPKKKGGGFLDSFNPKIKEDRVKERDAAVNIFKVPLTVDREDKDEASEPYERKLYTLYMLFKTLNGFRNPPS